MRRYIYKLNVLAHFKAEGGIISFSFLYVVSAEKEGFEPPVQSPGQRFSRPPH
jgi:hypothetical protein